MLEGNLIALYQALKSNHADFTDCLKVKKNKLTFYDSRQLNPDLSELARAIAHTNHLFHKATDQISEDFHCYKNYLVKSGKGYFVDESQYFSARNNITLWNHQIRPFVKFVEKENDHRLRKFLNKIFLKKDSVSSDSLDVKTFLVPPIAKDLSDIQNVIDLEGWTSGPLPHSIFKKIFKDKPLSPSEKKDLSKWIIKVNDSSISLKSLHSAMQVLGKIYGKKEEYDPYLLESTLQDFSLKIFQKEDKKHLAWMQSLTSGSKVQMKDRTVTLGEEICNKTKRFSNTRVFNLEENDKLVAVISNNRLHLKLLDFKTKNQKNYLDLKLAQFLEFNQDHKVALMEKCVPLNHIKWSSEHENLSSQDIKILMPISQFLAKLLKQNETPKNFSINHIMIDQTQELKIFKLDRFESFDFTAIENFIFECSFRKKAVYKYLMKASGMDKHHISHFYHDLLKTSLETDVITVEDLSAIHLITDAKVVDHAKCFINKMREIKTSTSNKLFELSPHQDYQMIEKKVKEAILFFYHSYECSGLIWPSLTDDIINYIVE